MLLDRVPRTALRAHTLATLLLALSVATPSAVHPQPRFLGEGRVVAVDPAKPSLTVDHGPIPGLMPAMRMEFRTRAGMTQGLAPGDAVHFTLEAQGPEWLIVGVERPSASKTSPAKFAAPEFTLPTFRGTPFRLSDARGRVVLVNFWATWCVPCRTEMPAIERLYQRYRERGFDVVAVNLDVLSTAGVEEFLQEVRVTFPIALDPSWSQAAAYRVVGLPTTYLIDRAGQVVVRELGARNWEDDATRTAVEVLLRERAPMGAR